MKEQHELCQHEPHLDSFYQAAALYVGVPKWGKCRQKLAGITEEGKARNGDKEEVTKEGDNWKLAMKMMMIQSSWIHLVKSVAISES